LRREHKELYRLAVEKWGKEIQLVILMEECAELIHATSKYLRNGCRPGFYSLLEHNIMKEAEDVRLMLNQLEYGVIQKPKLWKQYRRGIFDDFKDRLTGEVAPESIANHRELLWYYENILGAIQDIIEEPIPHYNSTPGDMAGELNEVHTRLARIKELLPNLPTLPRPETKTPLSEEV